MIRVMELSRSYRLPSCHSPVSRTKRWVRLLGAIFYILLISILIGLGAEIFVSFTFLLEPFKDLSFAF